MDWKLLLVVVVVAVSGVIALLIPGMQYEKQDNIVMQQYQKDITDNAVLDIILTGSANIEEIKNYIRIKYPEYEIAQTSYNETEKSWLVRIRRKM